MNLWRVMKRRGRVACVAAAALASSVATAMSIMPPPAIALQFEARTDRLTLEGLLALDELAVRAGQCPAEGLAVHVLPATRAEPALTQRRIAVVQQRLERLGLKLAVEMKPLRGEDTARPRHRGMLLADVGAEDDVWCDLRAGSQAFTWADELGRYVEGAEPRLPAFWQRLSQQGRSSLALPLATAALCAESSDCTRHPELYHWLAEKALPTASPKGRRWWLLNLWAQAEDAEVERLRRRWALAPLTLEERAGRAHELASGGLPWAVIEQRLLQPGLMMRFGGQPMISGGPGPHWLLSAASRRGELDSFDRLIGAAGPAKTCFVAEAFQRAAALEDEFEVLKPHFASWSRGIATPYSPPQAFDACNPLEGVLVGAFCQKVQEEDGMASRYQVIWGVLQQAGITKDTLAVQSLFVPGQEVRPWQCKLEPEPGSASSFRPVAKP